MRRKVILRRRLFYLLLGFICCSLIFAFSFSMFGSNTATAYALWLEHSVDSAFNGAEHIYAADLNNDTYVDILGASSVDDTIVWYENDGSGNFSTAKTIGSLDGANCVYAADLDGDTAMDVIASADGATSDVIVWYENNGNETFQSAVNIDTLAGANFVHAANIDGDADIDVIASGTNSVVWYTNTDGSGTFSTANSIGTLAGANCVYAANIDGSGGIDVVASGTDTVAWYANDGGWTEDTIGTLTGANYVYVADVDGDTDMDVLAAADGGSVNIVWYTNTDGSGTFSGANGIDVSLDGANSVHAANVDGDTDMDVLASADGASSDVIVWYENDGEELFSRHNVKDTGFTGAKHVYTADIEGDSGNPYIDVVACAFGGGTDSGQIAWFSYPLGPLDNTGCFIATAAYGTPMAEEIDVLRDFRDQYLVTNPVGETLVDIYYKTSPPVAEFIDEHSSLKPTVRAGLEPVIAVSTVAVNTTLAQKIAILSSIVLLSTLLIVWSRRRVRRAGV